MSTTDKKRMLIAAPLDYREDFRDHYSVRGYSTRFAQSQSFLISQINRSIDTDLLYDTIILDITFGKLNIDEILAFVKEKKELQDTKVMAAAPDNISGDAEMMLGLGADEVLLYSELDCFELTSKRKVKRKDLKRPDVLVVDDELASIKVITFFLKKEGCTFDCASSGKEALRLYSSRQYDAVFLDLMMPGMDGFEFTKRVRDTEEDHIHTPIVAVTALEQEKCKDRCLELGMDAYVSKPISAQILQQVLKDFVTTCGSQSKTETQSLTNATLHIPSKTH